MKVAIIHYWFITRRGGEKVVESILKLYPQADIYTLFYDEKKYGNYLKKHKVFTSSPLNFFKCYPLFLKSIML